MMNLSDRKEVNMKNMPEMGFLRLNQILGDPKAVPPIPPIIPVCKATWANGVKEGKFPAPVSFGGSRAKFYRVEDIRKLIESAK